MGALPGVCLVSDKAVGHLVCPPTRVTKMAGVAVWEQ